MISETTALLQRLSPYFSPASGLNCSRHRDRGIVPASRAWNSAWAGCGDRWTRRRPPTETLSSLSSSHRRHQLKIDFATNWVLNWRGEAYWDQLSFRRTLAFCLAHVVPNHSWPVCGADSQTGPGSGSLCSFHIYSTLRPLKMKQIVLLLLVLFPSIFLEPTGQPNLVQAQQK